MFEFSDHIRHDFSEIYPKIIEYINSKDSLLFSDIVQYFVAKGFEKKIATSFSHKVIKSWETSKEDEKTKKWALTQGFLPTRVTEYNLNNLNVHNYLSDFDYFILHPYNNHFVIWINDKLTLKYMLEGIKDSNGNDYMPQYYLYVENDGKYTFLMDFPVEIEKDKNCVVNLLDLKNDLAIKPSRGARGLGFLHLSKSENKFFINNYEISKEHLIRTIENLKGCIVTEYVQQHHELNDVWDKSVCTLRIITAKNYNEKDTDFKVDILSSYARFGTQQSNSVSNLDQGGIGLNYDFYSGKYDNQFWVENTYSIDNKQFLEYHPDSGFSAKGKKLPNWEMVRDCVIEVSNYLSTLDYLGFDIMITEHGVKICEINSLPVIDAPQIFRPWGLMPEAIEFFNRKYKERFKN